MEDDTYLSLYFASEGSYKEKGSKFMAFAYPVRSEEDVKEHLDVLRKKYHDARHHCYAYMLGKNGADYRANDDGEPNHSAGDPILGQIRSHSLTDTLIVVVRYFGGTKLGVSGLIHAYKTAASDAIASNVIIKKIETDLLEVRFDYLSMNEVMRLVKDYSLEIVSQNFDNVCTMQLRVRLKLKEEVLARLKLIDSVKIPQQH